MGLGLGKRAGRTTADSWERNESETEKAEMGLSDSVLHGKLCSASKRATWTTADAALRCPPLWGCRSSQGRGTVIKGAAPHTSLRPQSPPLKRHSLAERYPARSCVIHQLLLVNGKPWDSQWLHGWVPASGIQPRAWRWRVGLTQGLLRDGANLPWRKTWTGISICSAVYKMEFCLFTINQGG